MKSIEKSNQTLLKELNELTCKVELLQAKIEADRAEFNKMEEMNKVREALLNSAYDAIIVRSYSDEIIYWNEGAVKTYGWEVEEVKDKVTHNLLKTSFPIPLTRIGNILASQGFWEGELIHICKDGHQIVVSSRWVNYYDITGKLTGILEINREITKAKLYEESLRKSEIRFRAIFEDAPIGVAMIDSVSGKIYELNAMFAKIAGRTMDEMANIDWISITHPDDIQLDLDHMSQLVNGRIDGFQIEKRYIRPDGTIVWINMKISRLIREHNMPMVHLCMIEDITESKHTENLLRLSEEKYRTIVDSIGEGIGLMSSGEVFEYANQSAERIFGVEKGSLIGMNLRQFISDEQYRAIQEETVKRSNGTISVYELDISRQNGEKRKIVVTAVPQFDQEKRFLGTYGVFRDITLQKRAEEKQRLVEERFHATFELPIVGYAITSVDKGWIEVNSAFQKMLGYSKTELECLTWSDLTHPEDLNLDETQFNRILAGEIESYTIEKRYIRKDGEEISTSLSVGCVRKSDHSVNYFVALIQNISDRKLAEKALELSEEKYRIIFANSPNPMIIIDLENLKFFEVNQAAINFYGYSKEEFSTITLKDIRPAEDIEILHKYINQVNIEINPTIIVRHRKKNGELADVEITMQALIFNGKKARHVIVNDITQRKQLEYSLMSKTSLLEAQLNSVTEGILVVQQGVRILHNKRYEEIFNIPQNLLQDKQHNAILNYIAGLNKSPEQFIVKANYLNSNPEEKSKDEIELNSGQIIERYSAPVLGKAGEYYGRIWTFRDITELKKAELEIKHKNSTLQKVIADKDKFYSIIAHDLRGPIGGIAGMTEMMADPSQIFSDEERNELTHELSESAKNSFNLLEQLLEWSRMESGTIEFKPQRLILNNSVDESLKSLSKLAKEKGIELLVQIPANAVINADLNMLQTIIRNLTSNAIKYTRPGGRVTLSATPDQNNMINISVKDTGIGMSNKMIEKIYNSDLNVKRKGTNGEASSGLGLQLCREFVIRHSGKICITSEEGIGSEISFNLPCIGPCGEIKVSNDVETEKIKEPRMDKIKLLVVEDDMISSRLISAMVKNLCREIINVRNGEEAIQACRIHQDMDLILMDIQMPEIDGYEATRQIRQFNKDVIIIAQTALASGSDIREALSSGCNDHIAKPINPNELNLLIKKYFN